MTDLLNTVSMMALMGGMTATERRVGRFLRAPDEHPAGGDPAPAAPEVAPADNGLAMGEIEPKPAEAPAEVTAESLEKEFGDPNAPAEPKAEEPKAEPDGTKPKEEEPAKSVEKSAAQTQAEERAAEAQRQADYWRGVAEGKAPTEPAKSEAKEVDPNAEPKAEDYEFGEADVKYITDVAKWSARQEFNAQQAQAEQRAEFSRLDANYQSNIAKVTERLPDFDEKVTQTAQRGEWPCPPLIAMGIRDSDVGPDIAYHLATNVAEAKRIAALDPYLQARELGRLEARFMGEEKARADAAKTPAQPKVSQAPTPPASLARGAGGKFTVNADTDDFASFDKAADKILAS